MATTADKVSKIAAETLAKVGNSTPRKPLHRTAFSTVQTFSSLLSRNLVTNMANNFLCYLSEIFNRGIVNDLFLSRIGATSVGDFQFAKGEVYHVDFARFVTLSRNAIKVALHLDDTLGEKFKLKRAHYKNRLAAKDKKKLGDALFPPDQPVSQT